MHQAGEGGRRIAVIGSARDVGTTLTAIALARSLARTARVVLVDLAFASPNIDVISNDPAAPGIADLVRGTASFGDIITRDRVSRAHLVAAGQVGNDAARPAAVADAVGRGRRAGAELRLSGARCRRAVRDRARAVAATAPYAVLVGGRHAAQRARRAAPDQLQAAGFAEVAVLTGPPPALEAGRRAIARHDGEATRGRLRNTSCSAAR